MGLVWSGYRLTVGCALREEEDGGNYIDHVAVLDIIEKNETVAPHMPTSVTEVVRIRRLELLSCSQSAGECHPQCRRGTPSEMHDCHQASPQGSQQSRDRCLAEDATM